MCKGRLVQDRHVLTMGLDIYPDMRPIRRHTGESAGSCVAGGAIMDTKHHLAIDRKLLGKEFPDIHDYIDEPYHEGMLSHRFKRHGPLTAIKIAKKRGKDYRLVIDVTFDVLIIYMTILINQIKIFYLLAFK